jgi:Ni/Fe-hydrogenase 1 B-type cytochrome subunit
MVQLERILVWEAPVRILHWIHAAAIVVLALTGLYIGYPFISYRDVGLPYLMGWIRAVHFTAGFIFVFAFLVRSYWFFRGNHYERWHAWIPANRRRWVELARMLKYYLFLESERPNYIGVNPVAGLVYLFIGLLIVVQALTGFALFSLPFTAGFWQGAFGWIIIDFGVQRVRLVHHLLLWLFVAFFIVHIYLSVLDDIEEGTGDVVSIISGGKYERTLKRR